MPDTLTHVDTRSDTPSKSTGSTTSEISDSESNSFDSEPNTPKRLSLCSEGEGVQSEEATDQTIKTDEMVHANGQEHSIQSSISSEQGEEDESKSASSSEDPYVPEATQHTSTDADNGDESAPVPAPRRSSTSKKNEEDQDQNTKGSESEGGKAVVMSQKAEYENPPGFLYKVKCLLSKVHCHIVIWI